MTEHDVDGVSEPSRRRLLKSMGALGGALALSDAVPAFENFGAAAGFDDAGSV